MVVLLPAFPRFGEFCGVSTMKIILQFIFLWNFENICNRLPSSVMLKKLSFDGTDSDVVLEAELIAVCFQKKKM